MSLQALLLMGARHWDDYWFSSTLSSRYSAFRVAHGLTLGLFLFAWWQHAAEWLTPYGFHLPNEFLPPLSQKFLPLFACLQFGSLFLLVIGWRIRLNALLSWVCLWYVTSLDHPSAFSINNIYLFSFAVMAVFPPPEKNQPAFDAPARLLQLALVAIYFSSGWHKAVFGDWLSSPHVLETAMKGTYMTEAASWALRHFPAAAWTAAQGFVLFFELCSPVLFFPPKLRPFALAAGCLFHLSIALFMNQLIFFSLQMMSFYLLFLPSRQRKNLSA